MADAAAQGSVIEYSQLLDFEIEHHELEHLMQLYLFYSYCLTRQCFAYNIRFLFPSILTCTPSLAVHRNQGCEYTYK